MQRLLLLDPGTAAEVAVQVVPPGSLLAARRWTAARTGGTGSGDDPLFTADAGRHLRLDDPAVRSTYRYGFGVRIDGGAVSLERFAVRQR